MTGTWFVAFRWISIIASLLPAVSVLAGPQPTGIILGKPVPRVFQHSDATFGWNDQLINKATGVFRDFSANVNDLDDTESDIYSGGANPPQILWDDPKTADPPGTSDVTWSATGGGAATGNPVQLEMPVGGTEAAVTWDVKIASLDDQAPPDIADDPAVTNVDTVTYKVFRDHLARDMANEADLVSYSASPVNCVGAARHAYDGTISGDLIPPWDNENGKIRLFQAEEDPSIPPVIDLTSNFPYVRGGVVVFNRSGHIATCTGNADGFWEFNGRCYNPQTWGTGSVQRTLALRRDPLDPTPCFPDAPLGKRFVTMVDYYPPPSGN